MLLPKSWHSQTFLPILKSQQDLWRVSKTCLYCMYFGVKSCLFWSQHLGESRILPIVTPTCTSKSSHFNPLTPKWPLLTWAIPFKIHTPPVDEIFWGESEEHFWGGPCVGTLSSFKYFWRILEKIPILLRAEIKYQLFVKWGMCRHFDLLLLKGWNSHNLVNRGVWILNGMAGNWQVKSSGFRQSNSLTPRSHWVNGDLNGKTSKSNYKN